MTNYASILVLFFLLFNFATVNAAPSTPSFSLFGTHKWNRVYLATYPRSGNHWSRYLIEEASGIATSSLYEETVDQHPPHLKHLFPWGGYCPFHGYEGNRRYPTRKDIVVIKTHRRSDLYHPDYQAAIRIVRHPLDSLYSHYVLRCAQENQPIDPYIPREFLLDAIRKWKEFQDYWDGKPNVVTFRYEDMLENPFDVLKEMLNICRYKCTDADIQRAVDRYPPEGYPLKHLKHYTEEDLELVFSELGERMKKYGYGLP